MKSNSLQDLISPTRLTDFFSDYWEQKPLIVRRNTPTYFSTVLTENDVNAFLTRRDLAYPFIRLVSNGRVLPMADYLRHPVEPGFPLIDSDKMFSVYRGGGTIIIQKGQLSIPTLMAFTDDLENDAGFSVNANLYVTQQHTPGFDPHYDTHDIFIMQIAGRKSWQLYDCLFPLPLSHQSISKADSDRYVDAKPDLEVELCPGDLIYIPRGLVHNTFTTDSTSIHITLGLFPYHRIDVLRKIVEQAEMHEEFRRFIPTKYATPEERQFFSDNFKTVVARFISNLNVDELLQSFHTNFLAQRPPDNTDRLRIESQLANVSLDTILLRPKSLSFQISALPAGLVSLNFYDKRITFPGFVRGALDRLANATMVRVRDLDDAIDDEGKVVLARTLLAEGFCRAAADAI